MEVLSGHRAVESVRRTSSFTRIVSPTRFFVGSVVLSGIGAITWLGSRNEAEPEPTYMISYESIPELPMMELEYSDVYPDVGNAMPLPEPIDAETLTEKTSLIGNTLRFVDDQGNNLIVSVEKTPEEGMSLEVNGKSYAIENSDKLPNITLAKVLDGADVEGSTFTLVSKTYGTAKISDAEAKRHLATLGGLELKPGETVTLYVTADFTPKEGTMLAGALAVKQGAESKMRIAQRGINAVRANMPSWLGGKNVEASAPEPEPLYEIRLRYEGSRPKAPALLTANSL